MGSPMIVPKPIDEQVKKAMDLCKMSLRDLAFFWKDFQALARDQKYKRNYITVQEFCLSIQQDERNSFTKAMFRLVEINSSGNITFGQFLHLVVSLCLLEQEELVKFCFYIFDQDRSGFLDATEFNDMLECLYKIEDEGKMSNRGYLQVIKSTLEIADDGRVDFTEMQEIIGRYPNLFFPVFKLQNKIMSRFMGVSWWTKKKRLLHDERVNEMNENDTALQTNILLERLRQRKLKQKMGLMMYYAFPWRRKKLEDRNPKSVLPAENASEVEFQNVAGTKIQEERIPETIAWKVYSQKKERSSKSLVMTRDTRREKAVEKRQKRLALRRDRRAYNEIIK